MEEAPPPPRLAALEGLLTLRGYATAFHYVPGTLDRAAHTQSRLEALAETFFKVGREPPMIEVWVLDRETWEGAGLERPYGLPQVVGPAAFAIPGWGDEGTVAAVEELFGGPVDPLRDVPAARHRRGGGALAVADALLQVEASLDLMLSTGLEVEQPWLLGLLSQLLARLTFERFEPGRMPEIAALFDAMAAAHGGAQAHRLEDYRFDLPLEEERLVPGPAAARRGRDLGQGGGHRRLALALLAARPGQAGPARRGREALQGARRVGAGELRALSGQNGFKHHQHGQHDTASAGRSATMPGSLSAASA